MDIKGVKATLPTPGKLIATRPLEIVQIDHTKVDVVVVDEDNRKALPGRPYLTLAIDVFSRMVTGFELSMSEPSRLSNGLCMLRATFDKTAWLAEHVVIEEWPVVGLPERIGVDNGTDFKSAAFQRACENEGVRVEFRPFRRLFSSSSRSSTTRAQHECPRSQFLANSGMGKTMLMRKFCTDHPPGVDADTGQHRTCQIASKRDPLSRPIPTLGA